MSGYREHGETEKETEVRLDTSAETGRRVYNINDKKNARLSNGEEGIERKRNVES